MMSHRIKFIGKLPGKAYLACSGGPDSMAILDFLRNGKKDITVIHFNHGTDHGADAERFLTEYCREKEITIVTGSIDSFRDKRSG